MRLFLISLALILSSLGLGSCGFRSSQIGATSTPINAGTGATGQPSTAEATPPAPTAEAQPSGVSDTSSGSPSRGSANNPAGDAIAPIADVPNPGDARLLTAAELGWVERNLGASERNINVDQSFWVNLRGLGEVAFVLTEAVTDSSTAINDLEIFVMSPSGEVVHQLPPDTDTESWVLWEIKAVSFMELDFDGSEPDVIVIADYITGIGPTGSEPFPVTTVYLNQGSRFIVDQQASRFVTDQGASTIAEAEEILRNELNFLP